MLKYKYMDMGAFQFYQLGGDFAYSNERIILKGKRTKRLVDIGGQRAFLKFPPDGYNTSKVASEKIAYEIAKELGLECARVELGKDEAGNIGILNFLFVSPPEITHTDIGSYLKETASSNEYAKFYTLTHIKVVLDSIDGSLFPGFAQIMVFDALIGEQDRHEDNWGILNDNGELRISPLYDNGDSLARDLANEESLLKYDNGKKDFDVYIRRSKTYFRKEPKDATETAGKYKHFELIDEMNRRYPELMKGCLSKIAKLDEGKVRNIVMRIPGQLLTELHKFYIIKYIITRKQKLIEKLNSIM